MSRWDYGSGVCLAFKLPCMFFAPALPLPPAQAPPVTHHPAPPPHPIHLSPNPSRACTHWCQVEGLPVSCRTLSPSFLIDAATLPLSEAPSKTLRCTQLRQAGVAGSTEGPLRRTGAVAMHRNHMGCWENMVHSAVGRMEIGRMNNGFMA